MFLKTNQNIIWKDLYGQNRGKQFLKFAFPLHTMSFCPKTMGLMDMKMCNFMDIGDQKFKSVKIFINRDSGCLSMPAGEVTRLGNSFFTKVKVKRILFPKLNTIAQRGSW